MSSHVVRQIDLASCSDTLLNLELNFVGMEGYNHRFPDPMDDFIESLKSLRKLRSCSLLSLPKYPEIFEVILQFKELRFVRLSFKE